MYYKVKVKVIDYTYIIPLYNNRHPRPYGRISIIGVKGKPRTLYYELGSMLGNYEVVNEGTLYEPKIAVWYYQNDNNLSWDEKTNLNWR